MGEVIRIHEHGFVELIDVMGDDRAIAQAARTSFGNDQAEKSPAEDRNLIRYLLRHYHTTPFEMVEFKFHAKMPIHVARQWIRHRTANVNEISGRYAELPPEFYVPAPERVRAQSTSNKQGSSEELLDDAAGESASFRDEAEESFRLYKARVDAGMALELARNNLPLSTYTRWYWKIDLHNLFGFLRLRLDPHAQEEIRLYAQAMARFVKERCPVAYEAFEDYRLHAFTFSREEAKIVACMINDNGLRAMELAGQLGKREREEFQEKIDRIFL